MTVTAEDFSDDAPGASERHDFTVDGMHCAGCAARLERVLDALPGVREANVNFALERATVHLDPAGMSRAGLEEAVTKYNARVRVFDVAETWWLSLVGKNLTDELVMGFGGGTGLDVGGYRASAEPPRSVYLEGGVRF